MADRREPVCKALMGIARDFHDHGDRGVASSAMNHLIRQYGEHLKHRDRAKGKLVSHAAFTSSEKRVKDHVVTVKTLVDALLALPLTDLANTKDRVTAVAVMLQDHIRVVEITVTEHNALRKAGYESGMTPLWAYDDDWRVRHKELGIIIMSIADGRDPEVF